MMNEVYLAFFSFFCMSLLKECLVNFIGMQFKVIQKKGMEFDIAFSYKHISITHFLMLVL